MDWIFEKIRLQAGLPLRQGWDAAEEVVVNHRAVCAKGVLIR